MGGWENGWDALYGGPPYGTGGVANNPTPLTTHKQDLCVGGDQHAVFIGRHRPVKMADVRQN